MLRQPREVRRTYAAQVLDVLSIDALFGAVGLLDGDDWLGGQPIASRIDVYQGYEYRFHEWLCDEHARDGRARARGFSYRIVDEEPALS